MADDSELDYIRTFCLAVMTGYTIKHSSETKELKNIDDTQRGLIFPGEILYIGDVYKITRYKIQLSDATEAALTTGINNLIIGKKKYNRRETIAAYTPVASMTHISLSPGSISKEVGKAKRWKIELSIDIVWSVG